MIKPNKCQSTGASFHVLTLGVNEMRWRGKTMLGMRPVKAGWHPVLLKGLQFKPARATPAP